MLIESRSFGCPLIYWGMIKEVEVSGVSGQGPGCTATYWGNVKSIVFDQVQVLRCCKPLSGDKREGTWIVGLLRNESLDSRAMRRNLGCRVTSK